MNIGHPRTQTYGALEHSKYFISQCPPLPLFSSPPGSGQSVSEPCQSHPTPRGPLQPLTPVPLPTHLCYKQLTTERKGAPPSLQKRITTMNCAPKETMPTLINARQLPLGNGCPALLVGTLEFLTFTEERQAGPSAQNMRQWTPHTKQRHSRLFSETLVPYGYARNHVVLLTTQALPKTSHPEHGQVLTMMNSTVGRNSRLDWSNNKTKTVQ